MVLPSDPLFNEIFHKKFGELVASGVSPTDAAAAALRYTSELPSSPSLESNDQMDEDHPTEITSEKVIEMEPSVQNLEIISEQTLNQIISQNDQTQMIDYIMRTFSNPEILGHSFESLSSSSSSSHKMKIDQRLTSSSFTISFNSDAIDQSYQLIQQCHENEIYWETFLTSASTLLSCLNMKQEQSLRAVVVLMHCPYLLEGVTPEIQEIVGLICSCIAALPLSGRVALTDWLRTECSKERFDTWLKSLHQFITISIYQLESYGREDLKSITSAVKFMSLLYNANEDPSSMPSSSSSSSSSSEISISISTNQLLPAESKVSYKDFINDAVNMELFSIQNNVSFVRMAYQDWLSDREVQGRAIAGAAAYDEDWLPRSYISYPFIISPATKAKILQIDAQSQMQRGQRQDLMMALLHGRMIPYLVLKVRRSNIVEDTMRQLVHCPESELKKPFKVIFDGEEGIDEGGPAKEFMQIVIRELLDPQFAMFKMNEESRLIYFNPNTFELGLEFELIGTLVGIAIFNSVILDISFPMIIYKKLKGIKPNLSDLIELDPILGLNLKKMLLFDGDIENVFGQFFQISYEVWGEIKTYDLKPNGENMPVTNENVQEYIYLYLQYILEDSVALPFQAFYKGFHRVCGGKALEMFRFEELELLTCGNPILDFEALERVTKYDDGFDVNSQTVKFFWKAVRSFDDAEKRLLLKFATGSDRAPINGLESLPFVISRGGPDSEQLPTSHTCFNHLLLPDYDTFEKLERKLKLAIHQSEGFGLL